MSRSRAKFCLDSSSPIYHPSISPSDSTHLSRTPNSKPYKGIDLDRSNSKTAILDEVATSASRCRGADVFSTTSRGKHTSSISASDSPFKRYSALGLGAPPMRSRDSTRGDSGASGRWDKDNIILDMPSTYALQQISPAAFEPKRHSRKQPAGLGIGHPPSSSLRTTSPPVSSPPTSLEPSGIGMLTSSLSIASDLCRLTSQPPSKLAPRRPQPQPRSRTRTRLFSLKMPHLTVSKFTKRLLYTIPESSASSLFHGYQHAIAGSEGVVRPFGSTLF
ncbi:hypothetical protein ARMSODRAFT_1006210 [Armillaria solidipes]|uniref:Uncharacterized protein n=1 Tax=Armillaria solidipes TaxID=1076256 RepID=A0A2H3B5E3_9AGAR|nr:hypothetical protein ARMSODRAFT_1006210 [Armillaria solidipes]